MSLRERLIDTGEVKLHVVSDGSGPPVVLLHGFPEFWYSWRRQLPALAAGGFEALAPDLRGYGGSDRPPGRRAYKIDELVGDIDGLIRALGHERARVVGHDWGGVIAWALAMRHPERVERLAILNAPHPAIMRRALLNPAQLRRSWYMFLFQLPGLPERLLLRDDFMPYALRGLASRPEAFSDEDLQRYTDAIRLPGAATAALNYYRALPLELATPTAPITCPTLVVWGLRDSALGPELLDGLGEHVSDLRIHRIPEASHWVQHDAAGEVNTQLLEFLNQA